MAKEKDLHITNNINIKVDGEKKKKKRKSRKGKHKKSKKHMALLGDGKQYPHTGQIYATGVTYAPPIAQPPPKAVDDYHKYAEDYLGGKKSKPLAITDKERPLAIKDSDKSTVIDKKTNRSSKKSKTILKSYKKAIILSEDYLGDPKNITLKKLKELMISHGATAEQLKKFTRETQRKEAVKIFLKNIEPEEPVVTHSEIYKSPLKTSHESPMRSS
jgi:hypothetical protein